MKQPEGIYLTKNCMKPYNLELSDGKKLRVESASAAEAMERALWDYRGRTIRRIYEGFDAQDKRYPGGGVEHDVPLHAAIDEEAVKPSRLRPKDQTTTFPFFVETKA
jgi:hypothetical protein